MNKILVRTTGCLIIASLIIQGFTVFCTVCRWIGTLCTVDDCMLLYIVLKLWPYLTFMSIYLRIR